MWRALPAMRFEDLNIHPSDVHFCVGRALWEDCWQSRRNQITPKHYVPEVLMGLLQQVIYTLAPQEARDDHFLPIGEKMYNDVLAKAAAARRGEEI